MRSAADDWDRERQTLSILCWIYLRSESMILPGESCQGHLDLLQLQQQLIQGKSLLIIQSDFVRILNKMK